MLESPDSIGEVSLHSLNNLDASYVQRVPKKIAVLKSTPYHGLVESEHCSFGVILEEDKGPRRHLVVTANHIGNVSVSSEVRADDNPQVLDIR